MQQEKQTTKIEGKEAENEGSIGKYLNKHIAPGHMYVVEDETNLLGSCLYNIEKPMMVITYKSYEQFIKDATKNEIEANLSDSEKTNCNITDEMIAEKQLDLADKPIKYKTGIQILDSMDLFAFSWQMKDQKVVLIDNYSSIVEDWYQELPQKPIQTVLQRALKEDGITVIVPKRPLITEDDEPAEMTEPVLWITDKYGMEDRFEKAKIEIVRMKDNDENGDLGTAIKRSLVPSQFYIIEKTPKMALSFYSSLDEPSAVFSQTKSSSQFLNDLLLWFKYLAGCQTGGFDTNDIGKIINALENRPMWIDDTKIHSVEELYEKCLQMKAEQKIQFAVIDDFQNLPIPKRVMKGIAKPDYQQLCQIAKELDIVLVALVDPSANNTSEQC